MALFIKISLLPYSLNPNVYATGLGKSQFSCRGGHFCREAALRKPEPGVYIVIFIVLSQFTEPKNAHIGVFA